MREVAAKRGGFGRLAGIVAAVALAAGLWGCVGSGSPTDPDSARLHQEAQADLARWDSAVAAAGGKTDFIPVGELTSQVGDWEEAVGNNNKPALMLGLIESAVSLPAETPPDGRLRRQDGSAIAIRLISAQQAFSELKVSGGGSCPDCTPLVITGAQLASGSIQTTRGPAAVPVWEFTLKGTAVRVTRVAVADRVLVVPPPWDSDDPPIGLSIDSASGKAGDRHLTVSFVGAPGTADKPCGADYTAEAVESGAAVVVIVTVHRNSFDGACTLVGALRTSEVELAAPLGERAVLEVKQGLPVTVELAG
jgi:hypothetical protein